MSARIVSAFVVCTGVCFAGAHLIASTGGDFGESSGSISDRRDDSNSQAEKEKGRINLENCRNGTEARHCTCTRADAGCGRRANTDRPSGREKGRAQPEHCLNATKSKTGDSDRTGASCGRAGSSRRACRKETSTEKTAATCCATGRRRAFRRPFRCRFRWHNLWQSPRLCLITRTKRNGATSPEAVLA